MQRRGLGTALHPLKKTETVCGLSLFLRNMLLQKLCDGHVNMCLCGPGTACENFWLPALSRTIALFVGVVVTLPQTRNALGLASARVKSSAATATYAQIGRVVLAAAGVWRVLPAHLTCVPRQTNVASARWIVVATKTSRIVNKSRPSARSHKLARARCTA